LGFQSCYFFRLLGKLLLKNSILNLVFEDALVIILPVVEGHSDLAVIAILSVLALLLEMIQSLVTSWKH